MSAGNFASLTASLLVRKGEAEPSPVMPSSEAFPFAQRVVPAPVNAPVPARPAPQSTLHIVPDPVDAPIPAAPTQSKRRELPAPPRLADVAASTDTGAPAKPRRMFLQLSATEYEALGLVAVKTGTTPQHLLRKALHDLLAQFVEQCKGSCTCIQSGCDQFGQEF